MTYTLTAHPNTIVRDEDGAFIPTDPDNTDYQEYLRGSTRATSRRPTRRRLPLRQKEQNSHGRNENAELQVDEARYRRGCVELGQRSQCDHRRRRQCCLGQPASGRADWLNHYVRRATAPSKLADSATVRLWRRQEPTPALFGIIGYTLRRLRARTSICPILCRIFRLDAGANPSVTTGGTFDLYAFRRTEHAAPCAFDRADAAQPQRLRRMRTVIASSPAAIRMGS